MFTNIKSRLNRQSIIQSTILKVTLGIFAFLIISIIFYGKNYWEKKELDINYYLLSNTSFLQSNIQSKITSIEIVKNDELLSQEEKKLKITSALQPLIINQKSDYNIFTGYYDIDLNLIVVDEDIEEKDIPFNNIKSTMEKTISLHNLIWNKNEILAITLPIYNDDKLSGYAWAYIRNYNYVYVFYRNISWISIATLSLAICIIVLVRKNIKQIELYLERFCKMIIDNESQSEQILLKLPELQPVLSKISFFTNTLKQANQDL